MGKKLHSSSGPPCAHNRTATCSSLINNKSPTLLPTWQNKQSRAKILFKQLVRINERNHFNVAKAIIGNSRFEQTSLSPSTNKPKPKTPIKLLNSFKRNIKPFVLFKLPNNKDKIRITLWTG